MAQSAIRAALGRPLLHDGPRAKVSGDAGGTFRQAKYALETLCIGGGQGLATILERA